MLLDLDVRDLPIDMNVRDAEHRNFLNTSAEINLHCRNEALFALLSKSRSGYLPEFFLREAGNVFLIFEKIWDFQRAEGIAETEFKLQNCGGENRTHDGQVSPNRGCIQILREHLIQDQPRVGTFDFAQRPIAKNVFDSGKDPLGILDKPVIATPVLPQIDSESI